MTHATNMDRGDCRCCKQRQVLGIISLTSGLFFCSGCWDQLDEDGADPPTAAPDAPSPVQHFASIEPPDQLASARECIGGGSLRVDRVDLMCCHITVVSDPEGVFFRGVGQRLWQGARRMIRFFGSELAGGVRGRRILELGSGTGAVGIALAKMGASVCITDLPWLLQLARYNIEANGLADDSAPKVFPLSWGNAAHFVNLPLRPFHDVVGSDVTYRFDDYPILFNTLEMCCKDNATVGAPPPRFLLSQTQREDSVGVFRRACEERGWGINVVGDVQLCEAETLGNAFAFVVQLIPPAYLCIPPPP
eukprot:Hpha_TRINITY_DN17804_c0_g1::TRINITY_DN17804_c0_g1_i1::g.177503::m.177503